MQLNFERYHRNIIIDSIGTEGQIKLLDAKVLVAGAGGLGSVVISNLASVGIGTIGILDNDRIELSNLNRQYIHKYENIGREKIESAQEWIKDFNPDINVKTYPIRLNESNSNEIIKDFDLVIDCFDSFRSKFALNEICVKNEKTLIHGGVSEFSGQVKSIIPTKTACLRCLFHEIKVDEYSIRGVFCPAISVIASLQSMEAAKQILNFKEIDNLLVYDGIKQRLNKIKTKKNPSCPVCGNMRSE